MTRWARILLVVAGIALLVGNGACALGGADSYSGTPGNYDGVGTMLVGMLVLYAGVPLGFAALLVMAYQERPLAAALLAVALVAGTWFFAAEFLDLVPSLSSIRVYLAVFGVGAVAAAAALVLALPRRPIRPA